MSTSTAGHLASQQQRSSFLHHTHTHLTSRLCAADWDISCRVSPCHVACGRLASKQSGIGSTLGLVFLFSAIRHPRRIPQRPLRCRASLVRPKPCLDFHRVDVQKGHTIRDLPFRRRLKQQSACSAKLLARYQSPWLDRCKRESETPHARRGVEFEGFRLAFCSSSGEKMAGWSLIVLTLSVSQSASSPS